MPHLDVSCFSGAWPFHKTCRNTLAAVAELHRDNGMSGGLVSAFNSLFWNDPWEAELELAEELTAFPGYRQLITVNPTLPGYQDDLSRAVKAFPFAGVRVAPSFQGWYLNDPRGLPLWCFLRERHIPLFLTLRMEDERTTYLYHPRVPAISELRDFLTAVTGFPVVLSNIRDNELTKLQDIVLSRTDVFADTAGFKGTLFFMDNIADTELPERCLYGSLEPLYTLRSTQLVITTSRLSEARKERILSCSALRMP